MIIKKSNINQCDGCRRGVPVNEHNHHIGPGGFWAGDTQACTAYLYGCTPINQKRENKNE